MATENIKGSSLVEAGIVRPIDHLLGIQDGVTYRFPASLFIGSVSSPIISAVNTYSADHTILDVNAVVLVDATSGVITITLNPATGMTGHQLNIKKIDSTANLVTIDGNASETIDGELTQIISLQHDSVTIVSDGSNWHII